MRKLSLTKLISVLSVAFIAILFVNCTNKSETSVKEVSPEAAKVAPLFKSGNFQAGNGDTMPYRYFEPATEENMKYPVMLYLHSENESGTDNEAQLVTTECATIWVEPDHLETNPLYVLAPQIPAGSDWISEPVYSNTLAMLNQFIEEHPQIDENRLYLVGFSMGGTGVWNMVMQNPKKFAAAMPISGNADDYLGNTEAWLAVKNFPFYIIHAQDDPVSPVEGSVKAREALEAAGNKYVGSSATACIWQAGSTALPHNAWYQAFHKFEVVYNAPFEQSLLTTNYGEISPTMNYTQKDYGNGITRIWDFAQSTVFVIEREDKALIVDAAMGEGDLLQFIRDNVLKNKNIDLEVFITHQHGDHVRGLKYFVDSPQLKKVYVHEYDKGPVIDILGEDAGKIQLVKEGDLISLGGIDGEVVEIPGHSLGSIVMIYDDYILSGDGIGTGYVGVGTISVEEYISVVQHLLDKMGDKEYQILAGHTGECRIPMTDKYVYDLLACAQGIVDGSIVPAPYWRNTRYVGTCGEASITLDPKNIHLNKAALQSLDLSNATLDQRRFAPFTANYTASVAEDVSTIGIKPVVRAKDYKALTVNGESVVSGEAYKANLSAGENLFSIEVTADDNSTMEYTLTVTRNI
jgi:glyoxylase-like metal-dependent hydrolase (beta-lactamase superfamily II)/poly(3-hydroxybutyrate) depolymerase